jgi:hypothetical protein
LIIGAFFIFNRLNTAGYEVAESWQRVGNLSAWHDCLSEYLKKNAMPKSLYDYCRDVNEISPQKVRFGDSSGKNIEILLGDPNLFQKEVEYELYSNKDGWFIKEKREGVFIKNIFMVDDKGYIYQIKLVDNVDKAKQRFIDGK